MVSTIRYLSSVDLVRDMHALTFELDMARKTPELGSAFQPFQS